jgi:hypothetical protein
MPIKMITARFCALSRVLVMALLLCIGLAVPYRAECQSSCSPTPLSSSEAKELLNAIPQALAAKHISGKISIIDWSPGESYRTESFYFYEVLSTKSTETTPLNNGVLGYFGVNRTTGQVVELNSAEPSANGSKLTKLQERLRKKHCVSQDLITKNANLPLER